MFSSLKERRQEARQHWIKTVTSIASFLAAALPDPDLKTS